MFDSTHFEQAYDFHCVASQLFAVGLGPYCMLKESMYSMKVSYQVG